MDQLIPIINKLQDVLAMVEIEDPIDLPQIVVVGSQSSGKSSVLESIVGRDFLPRGSGIVTRRPLILQLHHTRKTAGTNAESQEWGEFLHLKGQRFYNFADIKAEIERETDRLTGKNKGISPLPINLKIYSPNVLNLTLVDLPGLTKVPVGDQPKNIEELIRNMIIKFIEKPNCIILAVSAANADLANSDALKLAREVDPQGQRTVGVLTKLDIMDKGTDAMDVLQGRVYPLRLGFIGVVLRSQHDINTNKQVAEARRAEKLFFEQHPLYRSIANRCGIDHLAKSLSKTLLHHIRDAMPDLRSRVSSMLTQTQKDLDSLGDPRLTQTKPALLLHVITKFNNQYVDTIEGRLTEYITDELYGGARINYIFEDVFGAYIKKMDPLGNLSTQEIQLTMSNATGPKSALFVPEEAFEQLCKKLIRTLEDTALSCVDAVYDELHQIVDSIQMAELQRYHNLKERVREVVHVLLGECRNPARRMIIDLVAMEQAYINTAHPDFIGGGKAIQRILQIRARRQIQQEQPQGPSSPNSNSGFDDSDWAMMGSSPSPQLPPHHPHQPPTAPRDVPPELQAQYAAQLQREKEKERKRKEEEAEQRLKMLQQREAEERARRAQLQQQQQAAAGASSPNQPGSFLGFFSRILPGNESTTAREISNPTLASSSSSSAPPAVPSRPHAPSVNPQQPQSQQPSSQSTYSSHAQHNLASAGRMGQMPTTITNTSLTQDDFQTELIKLLLESYFSIVRNNIRDKVPKAIMHFMVNKSKESLQSELVKTLYKDELMNTLLEEAPDVAERRARCQQLLEVLQRANSILNEIAETPISLQ